jgi:hypothetical protein
MKLPIQAQPVNRKVDTAKITGGSIFPSELITVWDVCGQKHTYNPSTQVIVTDPNNRPCTMVLDKIKPDPFDVPSGSLGK